MHQITVTVAIIGTDDALDAAFPPVPSSAADDPGVTSAEQAAMMIEQRVAELTRQLAARGITVRVDAGVR